MISTDYIMPNCCDEGEGVCNKCGCCNPEYCEVCDEKHDGGLDNCSV
jgi:hypothetical protein